ncbi:MAG: AAA family ATPase, partial [Myxococcota bacterium]|nr:AAA family ATPase [Myxococcota bacterium]
PPRKQVHVHGIGLYMFGLRSFPFVGRIQRRDMLWNQLIDVTRRGASAVVIQGPEGCGKSHLARWLCERAEEVGAATSYRINYEKDFNDKGGLCEAITNSLRCQGQDVQQMTSRLQQLFQFDEALFEAIPKIVSLLQPKGLNADQSVDLTEWERHGLFLRLLLRSSREQNSTGLTSPIVCWIDNAHWGAEGLRFCRSIISADHIRSIPILFILTMKPEELVAQRLERIEMAALRNHHRCKNIPLNPISQEEHRKILQNFLDLSPSLLDHLVRHTEGNPHFAKETIADWIRRHVLEYSPQGFMLKDGEEFSVPRSIKQAWKIRLGAATREFDDGMMQMSELAAMMGTHVYMEEWTALNPSFPSDKLREIVDELLRHRLARRWKSAIGWSFVHPVIPRLFIKSAEFFKRDKPGHLRIAQMLRSHKRVDTFERIGKHLIAAGEIKEGLSQLLRGAKIRKRRCEHGQTVELLDNYERCMRQSQIKAMDERWGFSWSIRFEIAYEQQNQELIDELKSKLRQAIVRYNWPYTQSHFLAVEGQELLAAGQFQEARYIFNRGSILASAAEDQSLHHRHKRGIIKQCFSTGNITEARKILDELSVSAQRLNDKYSIGMCSLYSAMLDLQEDKLSNAEATLQSTIKYFLQYKLIRFASEGINMLGDVYRKMGQWEKAEKHYIHAIMKMEEMNHPEMVIPQLNLAIVRLQKREYRTVLPELLELIPSLEANNKLTWALFARMIAQLALTTQNRWETWKTNLIQIEKQITQTKLVDADIASLALQTATLTASKGKKTDALRLFNLAKEQYRAIGLRQKEHSIQVLIDSL